MKQKSLQHSLTNSIKKGGVLAAAILTAQIALAQHNTGKPQYGLYTGSTTENKVPFLNTDTLFERAENVYKNTELVALTGGAKAPSGKITKVYFRTKDAAPVKTYTLKNVLIKMGQVDASDTGYNRMIAEPPFKNNTTQVFAAATYTCSTPGWIEFALTTPFQYDNTKNLVVELSGDEGFYLALAWYSGRGNWGKKGAILGNNALGIHEIGLDIGMFPASVSQLTGDNNVMLYPNPATNMVQVDFNEHVNGTMVVTDINGRTLLQQNINGKEHNFSVASFANGMYFYKIYNDTKTLMSTGKLTVLH